VTEGATAEHGAVRRARFPQAKFRPTTLPGTLVTRSVLHDRLNAGAGQRLTVVVGSAGAGKSVLLSSWAAARPTGATSWLSCDRADANPVRFWTGFIEAPRVVAPWFGADAANLLAMDNSMSADVTASIANDAAALPAGYALIVDDFHTAAAAVAENMTVLVEQWPAKTAQLVLASRIDPPLRLHRLRMTGDLCELRDRDLNFSLAESRDLLAGFGVEVGDGELALLHQRTEGWAAAVQMAALSLRGTTDPVRIARALELRGRAIAEFFVPEVLEQQPPEVAQFMLDTSILGELTADTCVAVTGRQDAAALLRAIGAAHLFLVGLDEEQTSFRYHHLVRQLLRAELRARDPAREQKLQLRAAEWFEATGDIHRAARHFLAVRQADRALSLLQDRVVPDFLADPAMPPPLDVSMVAPTVLADAPDRLLTLASDLLLSGDIARGGQYLDLLERARPPVPPESGLTARFAVMRSFRYQEIGQMDKAVEAALTARGIQERMQITDEWSASVPLILLAVYKCLEDPQAVEREAAVALTMPRLSEPARLLLVPGARALVWFEIGRLTEAADAARSADAQAQRLGFGRHFFAVDSLRVLAGLALERRDLGTAEQLTEQALSIAEQRRPGNEFMTLLDRAQIWAARGQVREALATIETARQILAGTGSVLLMRADELEALLRLSLGDPRTPAELASKLPLARRSLLLARIALASGDHDAAVQYLHSPSLSAPTPRHALVRQLLLAEGAVARGDPAAAGTVLGAVQTARQEKYLNTFVSTAPQVTSYLIEHAMLAQRDFFVQQLTSVGLQARAARPDGSRPRSRLAELLTPAELRVLNLLPTSTYLQMAATLYVSHNTIKTHLRSIYQKLGVESRSQALERAVELRLL
jgi:LuxR family transcriptional regulator, maltose regulon positive regulatory protein